jgi:hypothetical protein
MQLFARYSLFLLFIPSVFASERFADADLWLPKIYQKQYTVLVEAAEKAQADPYCYKLLSGNLIEHQSTLDHMIFQFRCRTEDNKTFSMQIDAKTFEVTNEYAEKQRELEAQRKAEEDRVQALKDAETQAIEKEKLAELQREQSRYWGICRKAMRKRLKLFEKVEILTEIPPDPLIKDKEFTYLVDFDAKSPSHKQLKFKITCEIRALDDYAVEVSARR